MTETAYTPDEIERFDDQFVDSLRDAQMNQLAREADGRRAAAEYVEQTRDWQRDDIDAGAAADWLVGESAPTGGEATAQNDWAYLLESLAAGLPAQRASEEDDGSWL